ncbi:MAG TPA: S26 family signal peptidase [Pirellulales bacterium]|jgi:signal peptidase I|nr:S26 family signal peptidase [Pirellulales bacterium]
MEPVRRICTGLALLGIAGLSVELLFMLGLFRPLRVESGSMAPTVRGPHYEIVCQNCGHRFAIDALRPPPTGYAACPLCGANHNPLPDAIELGARLYVDRTAFWWRDPRRWEPIVFRDPLSGQLVLKRVVGLPGETIAIRDGAVFVNGQRQPPPDRVRRAMAILVHDPACRPKVLGTKNEPLSDAVAYNQTESRRLNRVAHPWHIVGGQLAELADPDGWSTAAEPVYRDVYYTQVPRVGTGAPPADYPLGADEFFVLGDNSPISDDSRHWPRPGLPRAALVGKPLGIR